MYTMYCVVDSLDVCNNPHLLYIGSKGHRKKLTEPGIGLDRR